MLHNISQIKFKKGKKKKIFLKKKKKKKKKKFSKYKNIKKKRIIN